MAGMIPPTTTDNIGFGFGSTSSEFYEDRVWHGVFYPNFHGGIDYWGPLGYPVWSAANGIVLFAGNAVPYIGAAGGNGVVISHGPYMKTIYGHMNTISVVPGQAVVSGQRIGSMGMSGIANGVIHLHFEVRTITSTWGEDVENPNIYLAGGAEAGTGFANSTGDIPWLEPLEGTLIRGGLANPLGGNQWALPTSVISVIAVYFDRVLASAGHYTVVNNTIVPTSTLSPETEVRVDYTAG